MPGKHTEMAFEDAIVHSLTTDGGWISGASQDFKPDIALRPADFFAFVAATQPKLWADLHKQHGAGMEAAVLDTLVKSLESRGTLDVLRHGLKFYGKLIDCAYFKPAHGLNPDILARYQHNRLAVTRQVRLAQDESKSIDLVLSLNGLPIATAELKNPLTHQTVHHAIIQYRERDPKHRLLQFKRRALVHFAVDPDLVYMTTRLDRESTVFLPFNRGHQGSAGNPEHPSGYRTAYLWEEVWQRDSFLDIVGRFIHLVKEEKVRDDKKVQEEKIVFPRYHQLDAVRMLERRARAEGAGHRYLIQHSAGSGKSNSISWLAHHLASLHDPQDRKVFDSVVVITDRRVLDKQLQDNIYQFEHKQGVVAKIDEDSAQLAQALAAGTLIIITTLQKFPFVLEKITELPGRRYAVIIDEAHSSQTGDAAHKMKQVLATGSLEEAEEQDSQAEAPDEQDEIERAVTAVARSRGPQQHLSYFAFTATPKAKTLEIFGERDAAGEPWPHHLYSMRQAIEEGFILDVLASYTTYRSYYRLVQAGESDPRVPRREATRQLARAMSLHPYNIAQKTAVMVEHFREKVRHRIGGRAKAMVVTSSRLHAVRYKLAVEKYIREKGYTDIGVLVAFSGTVKDQETGLDYTEPGMNVARGGKHISEAGLPAAFEGDDYQLLLVANKYQTGFDQPLLHTMYVDKRLSGLQAVQTLSRLNRPCPGKEDTFILDFVNDAEEIRRSFQPYYEQATVSETADPQQLYNLAHKLSDAQVFWESEVAAFCRVFFAPRQKQSVHDQAEMHRHLNPGIDRFKALTTEEQETFRNALGSFVRLYAFLAQIMPFSDPDLEKLYTFARTFETKLPQDPKKAPLRLDGEVRLQYYRLDKIREGSIQLEAREPVALYGPAAVGTRKVKDEDMALSQIIDVLNERFGTEFTRADQLLFEQFIESAKLDGEVIQQATANELDNFALAMKPKVESLMIDRMDQNQEIVTRYLNDPQFKDAAFYLLVQRIYEEIRAQQARPSGVYDLLDNARLGRTGDLVLRPGGADRVSWVVVLRPRPERAPAAGSPWGVRLREREAWFARDFLDRLRKRFTVYDVGTLQSPMRDPEREARAQALVRRLPGIHAVLVSGAAPVASFLQEDPEIAIVLQGDAEAGEVPEVEPSVDLGLPADWHRTSVGANLAHDRGLTGRGVLIGVIDSGIDASHPEFTHTPLTFARFGELGLMDNLDPFGNEIAVAPNDPLSHGTYVCGIAVGHTMGIAPGAALAVAQVRKNDKYTVTQLAAGFEWMISLPRKAPSSEPGVDLINVSLGALKGKAGFTAVFKSVVGQCVLANKPVIAAIGNYGPNTHVSPANYGEVIGVGAIDHRDRYWQKSSRGAVPEEAGILKPDYVAPGVAVHTALPGTSDYCWRNGTSMAAPVATGIAALLMEAGHRTDLHQELKRRAILLDFGSESVNKVRF